MKESSAKIKKHVFTETESFFLVNTEQRLRKHRFSEDLGFKF